MKTPAWLVDSAIVGDVSAAPAARVLNGLKPVSVKPVVPASTKLPPIRSARPVAAFSAPRSTVGAVAFSTTVPKFRVACVPEAAKLPLPETFSHAAVA